MNILLTLVLFYFGAIIGSFLNVVIWRLPREETLLGRSHCVGCGHSLAAWDLFPVLSYIFLHARCRYCRKKISFRYPLLEIATGLLFAATWWLYNPAAASEYLLLVKALLVISVFVAVFAIDWEHYLILDSIIIPASAAVILFNLAIDLTAKTPVLDLSGHFLSGILGAVAATAPLFSLWFFSQGRWMGFGDVKFAILLGLTLGWPLVAVALMAAIFLGGGVSLILLAVKRKSLKSQIPFGTFLSLAAVIAMFYGEELLRWYLSYLGF